MYNSFLVVPHVYSFLVVTHVHSFLVVPQVHSVLVVPHVHSLLAKVGSREGTTLSKAACNTCPTFSTSTNDKSPYNTDTQHANITVTIPLVSPLSYNLISLEY